MAWRWICATPKKSQNSHLPPSGCAGAPHNTSLMILKFLPDYNSLKNAILRWLHFKWSWGFTGSRLGKPLEMARKFYACLTGLECTCMGATNSTTLSIPSFLLTHSLAHSLSSTLFSILISHLLDFVWPYMILFIRHWSPFLWISVTRCCL